MTSDILGCNIRTMRTEQAIANDLAALSASIYAADQAGKSARYTNKIWKLYFACEDELKAYNGSGLVL